MYCTPIEIRKARREHVCTYCGEAIEIGTRYPRWASYDDGRAFTNKMHPECLDAAREDAYHDGSFEYTPYNSDRPGQVR